MSDFVVTRKNVGGIPTTPKLVEYDLTSANIVLNNVPCESSVFVGAAVYMQASGIAKNAIATSIGQSNVIGIIQEKPELNLCNIRVIGVTPPVFTGLDVSKEYFLSDSVAGGVVTIAPSLSGHIVLRIGQPYSATEMLFIKGQRAVRI